MKSSRIFFAIAIPLFFPLFLSSCFSLPCKKSITITTASDDTRVLLQSDSKEMEIVLNAEESIKKDISDYPHGRIIIKTPSLFRVFQFGEYDHWFPANHEMFFYIKESSVEYKRGSLNIRLLYDDEVKYEREI